MAAEAPPPARDDGGIDTIVHVSSTDSSFRESDFVAAAQFYGVEVTVEPGYDVEELPFFRCNFPDEETVKKVCDRCVSVICAFELWAEAPNIEALHTAVENIPSELTDAYLADANKTFKFHVISYGRKLKQKEYLARINGFEGHLTVAGDVSLTDPSYTVQVLEIYPLQRSMSAATETTHTFFGRRLAGSGRHWMEDYSLKKRVYLGTTSMDAEMSFIQASLALAGPGKLVLDPFVGTGGLIVAAAAYGAHVCGQDIDLKALRGWGRRYTDRKEVSRNVWANFVQYGLEDKFVDLVVGDYSHPAWRESEVFDAIVADPPYGVRAGARKLCYEPAAASTDVEPSETASDTTPAPQPTTAHTKERGERIKQLESEREGATEAERHALNALAASVAYEIEMMLTDLLNNAAKQLVVGGRLVYWLPTTIHFKESDLPTHPCFEVIANCSQGLTSYRQRRLVAMVKIRSPGEGDTAVVPPQIEMGDVARDYGQIEDKYNYRERDKGSQYPGPKDDKPAEPAS